MTRRAAIGLTMLGSVAGIPACRESGQGTTGTGSPGGSTAASGAGQAQPPPSGAPPEPEKTAAKPPREGQDLVPVRVEDSLEIRTIAGLRPYRPSGFVVRREEVSGKTLIHNYGHGGGGFSLSWGSAKLAVDLLTQPLAGLECAIVGGGIMGLSTARLLQQQGVQVTIYTKELPPATTSNVAGAQWWPFSVFAPDRRTEAFSAQYVAAARFAYEYFQQFTGPEWGISWLPNYYLSDGPPENGWIGGPGGVLHSLQVGFRDFAPGEHVFSRGWARRFYTLLIEPSVYLPRLMEEFRQAGGKLVVQSFSNAGEVTALPQPILFNCTGLGAAGLFGDQELMPIKGQLTFLLPQPEVKYNLISGECYMFPRTDGILLGGTYEYNQWDTTPDPAAKRRILTAQRGLFERMAAIQKEGAAG